MNTDNKTTELLHLQNAIGEISIEIEKARYILQDIVEDYLEAVRPTKKQQAEQLLYDRPRASAKGQILTDILYKIHVILAEVDEDAADQEEGVAV